MDTEYRRRARQSMVVMACAKIEEKLGDQPPKQAASEIRIAAISAIAECRALWEFLIQRGLATEEHRQDALDAGYRSLLAQVEQKGMEIDIRGKPS